jgi:carboxyl-terminal processing protease
MYIKKAIPVSVALAILLFILPILGAGCDFIKEKVIPPITSAETNKPISVNNDGELPAEFDILVEAWKQLSKDYIDKSKLDPKVLSEGAVRGMMESLDPFSSYAAPDIHKLEMSTFEGKFEGIGAVISMKDNQLTVVAPIADSPAEKAGIKAGDKILEVDGESTSRLSLIEATFKIRGPKGTSVKLLVVHEGESEPVEIQIVRGEITEQSVSLEMRDDIAYVKITQFLKSTGSDLHAVLEDAINNKGAKGIILDLRNNPGGLLDAAADVASQFLAMGVVTKVVDNKGNESMVPVNRGGIATHLPLIVLVDGGSASASEIVAGALQDYGRAKLAGSQTFGKGSVQVVRELSDGSSLHITAYRWLTPFGRPIDGVGLTPDFALELKDEELVDWAIDYLKGLIKAELLDVYCLLPA